MHYFSPLRYPGCKTSLWKYIATIIERNKNIDCYIESFAGGAGAALALLFKNYVNRIILNDVDVFISSFWSSILKHTDEFVDRIRKTPVSIDEWFKQREILNHVQLQKEVDIIDIGFACFYLNRTNRSGILYAGPIGGKDQAGEWKIDARFNKLDLINRIEAIAERKDKIEYLDMDVFDFLKEIQRSITNTENCILYLDPPYYENGPKIYLRYFKDEDHINLAKYLKSEITIKWLLSYDDVPFINNLYKNNRKNGINMNHFLYKSKVGKELLITSDNVGPLPRNKGFVKEKRRRGR